MKEKRCLVCGDSVDLVRVKDIALKTLGWDAPMERGYLCVDCARARIRNE